ncbi:MAG TPA: radical SAM family heme chaperone HemW [Spirochaetota bacterium]|nr:radical SAM family heme chaperone HemW [Spirochaetota bacterium]
MISLYIHIPFCRSKCAYCDFLSFPTDTQKGWGCDVYVRSLVRELSFYRGESLKTVYIGGGTPTVLETASLEKLFTAVGDLFDLSGMTEYTIEVNPESLSMEKIEVFLLGGVNRVSVGVQSFDDEVLDRMHRPTRQKDIKRSIELLRRAGIDNVGMDLILGIGSEPVFREDLRKAILQAPEHISVYMLHIGEETLLKQMEKTRSFRPMGEAAYERLYRHTVRTLTSRGYVWYEVSNFSKAGYESRHNMSYWEGEEYIGTGVGAVSTIGNRRTKNTCDLKEYHRLVKSGMLPVASQESLGEKELLTERLLLGLRMRKGIALHEILKPMDSKGRDRVLRYVDMLRKHGYIEKEEQNLVLSVSGTFRSNYIVSELLRVVEGGMPPVF